MKFRINFKDVKDGDTVKVEITNDKLLKLSNVIKLQEDDNVLADFKTNNKVEFKFNQSKSYFINYEGPEELKVSDIQAQKKGLFGWHKIDLSLSSEKGTSEERKEKAPVIVYLIISVLLIIILIFILKMRYVR